MNEHDLEALVDVFDPDVISETPAHPQRTFRGADQVRRNWEQIFAGVPDLQADLLDAVVDGDTVWSEWDWRGTRRDGSAHRMRGVTIQRRQGRPRGLGPFLHGARRRGRARSGRSGSRGSSARRPRRLHPERRPRDDPRGRRQRASLGRTLIPLLVEHGEPVRVLTRGDRPGTSLALPGVEIVDRRRP